MSVLGGGWPEGLAGVFAEALGNLAAMLQDRARYEDRLLDAMFRSRRSCTACKLERRRVAAAAPRHAAEQLCFSHYLAATGSADEEQLACLANVAQRRAAALLERLEGAPGPQDPALEAASLWLAGAVLGPFDAPAAVPGPAPSCRVCRAARRAIGNWLHSVDRAVRLGVPLSGLLPLCPAHIAMSLARGRAAPARELARQATGAIAATLALGLAENERAAKLERQAARSVFHRPQPASHVLGLRRRALRVPRCAACESIELACERAQGEILDSLRISAERDAPAHEGELCLRHFAAVYLLAPHGEPRAQLAERQRSALERARDVLTRNDAHGAWRSALQQLGGTDG